MQVVLVMFTADGERRSFSLPRASTVIGRREDCDLRIPLGEVSRKHCRFIIEEDELRIEDMGSSNGTFVNGQRVQEAIIPPGAKVRVGPVVFTVQIDGEPADDEIQPNAAGSSDTSITAGLANAAESGESRNATDISDSDAFSVLESSNDSSDVLDLNLDEIEPIDEKKNEK